MTPKLGTDHDFFIMLEHVLRGPRLGRASGRSLPGTAGRAGRLPTGGSRPGPFGPVGTLICGQISAPLAAVTVHSGTVQA
jgi:hypothetical protein